MQRGERRARRLLRGPGRTSHAGPEQALLKQAIKLSAVVAVKANPGGRWAEIRLDYRMKNKHSSVRKLAAIPLLTGGNIVAVL